MLPEISNAIKNDDRYSISLMCLQFYNNLDFREFFLMHMLELIKLLNTVDYRSTVTFKLSFCIIPFKTDIDLTGIINLYPFYEQHKCAFVMSIDAASNASQLQFTFYPLFHPSPRQPILYLSLDYENGCPVGFPAFILVPATCSL